MQIQTDMVIRKIVHMPETTFVFEARLVNPNDHSEVYARGSYGLTEQEAIGNLTRRVNAQDNTIKFRR
jgi:hypothetical protein